MASSLLSSAVRRGGAEISFVARINPCSLLSNSFKTDASVVNKCTDPRYLNVRNAPGGYDVASAAVYPEFLSDEEGKSLIKEASKRFKRRRFEDGHWDSVITGYREVELSTADNEFVQHKPQDAKRNDATVPLFAKVIEETRRHLAKHHFRSKNDGCDETSSNVRWLPCHAIDLSEGGELSAHVDSVKFSGEIVAGLSLLSDSIMRLRPSSNEWNGEDEGDKLSDDLSKQNCRVSNGYVDLYLPQLSLYVLSGMSRYSYTHELLPSGSTFEFLDMEDLHSQYDDKENPPSSNNIISVVRRR
eukprot:CAMPEP_0172541952 /NCGR_PEP_ID=MMETSP1067-20121228/12655_1 /TAXON_ID=265564 ORGANISM="Thalassiosira punctigera, Strain Tpunct2005C2" /NCGR_SAMPLE_ID=MMETSP1067 /ASSEMBLY_ACC=CAM_ASM_000444 /LENGTH=300 /DNA_ID=CAMNT_0013328087 /DNA_START=99 /DNA_END=997 /DNA_ORIENTATION=-